MVVAQPTIAMPKAIKSKKTASKNNRPKPHNPPPHNKPKSKNKIKENARKLKTLEQRREHIDERKLIKKAFDQLVFSDRLPRKVKDIRSMIAFQIKIRTGKKVLLKTIDLYKEIWHPDKKEENFLKYICYGILTGRYYPSADNQGIFMLADNRGILPCEVSPYLSEKTAQKHLAKAAIEDTQFTCWLRGTKQPPYYNLILVRQGRYRNDLVDKDRSFRVQGKLVKQDKDILTVKIRENKGSKVKVNFDINIYGCTKTHNKGEFLMIDAKFYDSKLNCLRSVAIF